MPAEPSHAATEAANGNNQSVPDFAEHSRVVDPDGHDPLLPMPRRPRRDKDPLSEFDKKYPPDRLGEEMADSARIWTIYRDEAIEHDKRLINTWNKTLDVLLIFAGLFSAVATAFIVESYSLLQPQWSEYTAKLLFVSIAAHTSSTNLTFFEPPGLPSMNAANFSPSASVRWVNGVWVCSLGFSLAVALLSILAKQWIDQYELRTTGPISSTRDWCRRRALLYKGLKTWYLSAVFAALPALLHVSLTLFFVGLGLLFWELDRSISCCIVLIASILVGFYVASGFLTFWYVDCPFHAPLFRPLHQTISWMRRWVSRASRTTVADIIASKADSLEAEVLLWLTTSSPVPDVVAAAISALGAVHGGSTILSDMSSYRHDVWSSICDTLMPLFRRFDSIVGYHHRVTEVAHHSQDVSNHYRLGWAAMRVVLFLNSSGISTYVALASQLVAKFGRSEDNDLMPWSEPCQWQYLLVKLNWTLVSHLVPPEQSTTEDLSPAGRFLARCLAKSPPIHIDIALARLRNSPPPAPIHVAHTLSALLSLDQVHHRPWWLKLAVSLLHSCLGNNTPVADVLCDHLSALVALCAPYRISGLPSLHASRYAEEMLHWVLFDAIAIYTHILSHAAEYELHGDATVSIAMTHTSSCVDEPGGCLDNTPDLLEALLDDLALILRGWCYRPCKITGHLDTVCPQVTIWCATERFRLAGRPDDVLLSLLSYDVGLPVDAALRNLLLVMSKGKIPSDLCDWVLQVCHTAPVHCLSFLDPAEGEHNVSAWGMFCTAAYRERLGSSCYDIVDPTGFCKALGFLECMNALALRIRRVAYGGGTGAAPTLAVLARELFAPRYVIPLVRMMAPVDVSEAVRGAPFDFTTGREALSVWQNAIYYRLIDCLFLFAPDAWPPLRDSLLALRAERLPGHEKISLLVERAETQFSGSPTWFPME